MPSTYLDFEQLVRTLGDAVIVAGAESTIRPWNAAAVRLFGFSEQEALGRPLELIIPRRLRSRHNEGYANTVVSATTRYGSTLLRVPALHKDGQSLSIAFTVVAQVRRQGRRRDRRGSGRHRTLQRG